MQRSTILTATDAVANVERYLAAQYAKRHAPEPQRQTWDGVVVIVAWCVIGWILIGK